MIINQSYEKLHFYMYIREHIRKTFGFLFSEVY